ncbi:MAG: flagellar basal body P-ring protein FlgI [candidate division KSB1 bacterium]|nr:flagellar basal body P-ring protein FlgI [candidate division KSB1 bacterium]
MLNSYIKTVLITIVLLLIFPIFSQAGSRVKDIARIQGIEDKQLIGYGLVVGLDGTGDGRSSLFTIQSVTNMLLKFGITVPPEKIQIRNVASVMVTARLSPFVRKGTTVDVVVSSMGDASSLEGGVLLLTPLLAGDGTVYAHAQGPVSIGGFNIETIGGERIRKNYALVGRVPDGAVVEEDISTTLFSEQTMRIGLKEPDFTTANRLATAINEKFRQNIAVAQDAAEILVTIPSSYQDSSRRVEFIALIEALEITPDQVARVVINERTGTIAIGENVRIAKAAVSHGNLSIEIAARPVISQPFPFSQGETVVVPQTETQVSAERARLMVIEETASVGDVAKALNALGVTPRDMIAIFQALKLAGALQAELIIM